MVLVDNRFGFHIGGFEILSILVSCMTKGWSCSRALRLAFF